MVTIRHKGREYEITNWPEFRRQLMELLKMGVVNEIQDQAMDMKLFDSGRYIRGFEASYVDDAGVLHIDNDVEYAAPLEYGTFDYFEAFGLDNFPERPDVIKKKDFSAKVRAALPKGMMPFAPIRRVIYNQAMMDKIIKRQFA